VAWAPDGASLALSEYAIPNTDGIGAAGNDKAGVWIVPADGSARADGSGPRRVRSVPMGVAWQPVWP